VITLSKHQTSKQPLQKCIHRYPWNWLQIP